MGAFSSWGRFVAGMVAVGSVATGARGADHADLPDPRFDFHTFYVTWGGSDSPEMFAYLAEARPEIVQVCFFGPMFHGYVDNPNSTGYPMSLPVSGQRQAIAKQREIIARIHELGLKVVSHFQMTNVIEGDSETDHNFSRFYNENWPQDLLGPKPHEDLHELLQQDVQGEFLTAPRYHVTFLGLCPSSPHARKLLKAMLKLAVDCGVDGIMSNYNYYWGCVCKYCQASFKAFLAKHYREDQIAALFGIPDLAAHRFESIPARIAGYPDRESATALDWAAMRWAAINFKEAYDEVFIEYGRSLKPDLILATWNHLGHLSVSEERAFLPLDLWGRGENYFWYSGGYGPAKISEHKAGDGWLDCLYIRELSGGKRFMLGKYENVRMRNSIAEGVATGGAGMGLSMPIQNPTGYQVGVTYTKFLQKHRGLYREVEPHAEIALILPRQALQSGHPSSMETCKTVGETLVENHFLMEFVVDEKLSLERLLRYPVVVLTLPQRLSAAQVEMFVAYVRRGGRLLVSGPAERDATRVTLAARFFPWMPPPEETPSFPYGQGRVMFVSTTDAPPLLAALQSLAEGTLSRIQAPWTVRASAFQKADRLVLHFVNYNLDEEKAEAGGGPAGEVPVAAENLKVDLLLPPSAAVRSVTLHSPDQDASVELSWSQDSGKLSFVVPQVSVYSVVEIHHEPE